ncbi:MAG TPA: transaldolase [Gemmatimonadales bacterium]|nr:transaldolase [Gemmatimonadales bacterium]
MSDTPVNPLVALGRVGQSPWYDFITRDLVHSGELARLIREDGLLGMTSNPTIFEKAIASSDSYDADIRRLAEAGRSAGEIFEELAVDDVRAACDVFRATFERAGNGDGTVSLEVSPTLAHDTEGTVHEAERLWRAVDRPNAMIKIPGTREGLPAITRCLAQGINVNVTLLFSVERYAEVVEAFLQGLEQRAAMQLPIDHLHSVASFFVSRVDTKLDPELDRLATPAAKALRGTIAIANAAAAYALFREVLASPRWQALAAKGARPQRPLWASTSVKDKAYPDTMYVEQLVAAQTVNTLPPETFTAYRDHGTPEVRIDAAIATAAERLDGLTAVGLSLADTTAFLEADGVAKFAGSFRSLLAGIETKAGALVAR